MKIPILLFSIFIVDNFTLKDEIEFEKAKLLNYNEAMKQSEKLKLPIVVMINCHSNDVELFKKLEGKCIPCYLNNKNNNHFLEVKEGIIVGLWLTKNNITYCGRHDNIQIEKLNSILKVESEPFRLSEPFKLDPFKLDCPDGKCPIPPKMKRF